MTKHIKHHIYIVMDLFDWPITKTSDQTLGTPKMDILYSSLLDHLYIGYTRVELGAKNMR
jgi:hypothetical protein